ncbi:MAG: LamG domain-containing protein [Candidatus Poribacteria bacterium]|nr:LamG domain-containing protein [Candidatus Poribacteria bacterium]
MKTMWLALGVCGALLLSMSADAALVGLWSFDEGSGATAADRSGNGHNGAVNNGVWAVGKYGGAIELNGTDANVQVPHGSGLSVGNFSLLAWVNVPALTGNWQTIATQNTDGPIRNYGAFINNNGGVIHYSFTSKNAWQSFDAATGIVDGTWHHIAAIYDGAMFRLYIDGEVDAETANTNAPDNASTVVTIGSWVGGGYLKGRLDEVALYNHALTAAELANAMTGLTTAVEASDKATTTWALLKTDR